ncbi:MAG TPA: Asp-tRNA(Asn)/Glu-tRNA(Gln) amidotransferase subunit GatC [Gemmatimonadaceae bacterium]|nr:Asp-tRNA(Asn)/Glu-tRNA(Gln) amidotransferase subunit GatC [Gemmatimonadaceae bacterium]
MPISRDDVLHIAALARIAVPTAGLDTLAQELSGILRHMDALQRVPSEGAAAAADDAREGMRLRADAPPRVPLEHPRESFAPTIEGRDRTRVPAMMDGFFLVPRLATHEDADEEA